MTRSILFCAILVFVLWVFRGIKYALWIADWNAQGRLTIKERAKIANKYFKLWPCNTLFGSLRNDYICDFLDFDFSENTHTVSNVACVLLLPYKKGKDKTGASYAGYLKCTCNFGDDCRDRFISNSRKWNRLYWSRKFLMPLLYFISLTITF